MNGPAFHPLTLYPELDVIRSHWTEIRDEALMVRHAMADIADGRVKPGAWHMLPLLSEQEDREVFPEEMCVRNRRLAPNTTRILSAIPGLHGYAISALESGGRIWPHSHANPLVTAVLCLQDGGDAYTIVAGERRDYCDGEVIVFDYTLEHEVVNNGMQERIVLLVLLANRITHRHNRFAPNIQSHGQITPTVSGQATHLDEE